MDFLNHPETDRIIRSALEEDVKGGDYTSLSTIPPGTRSRARCLIKEAGVLAGVAFARRLFNHLDPDLRFEDVLADGDPIQPGDIAFFVEGSVHTILTGERIVLNVMQRMSGIATQTRAVADRLAGTNCRVLDTRKTTPLIRHLEKWAVEIGGGVNHRFGLYDMILIKDNHVDYAGGIANAINACNQYLRRNGMDLQIEIETRSLEEVKQALDTGGIHRIMLDNMSPEHMRIAVGMIGGKYETEASGGITLERVREVAETGVDFISMGALTHSVKSLDISLKAVV
jgi:nicotinate-nucleotide pyrophosphorylase (carboxylating)